MNGPVGQDEPEGGVHLEATVHGEGSVNQVGGDQHLYLGNGVRRVEGSSRGDDAECPYPGLAAFTRDQAKWFFGRDRLKADLIARVDAAVTGGGPVMVVAASGAGKSSLLRAGLLADITDGKLGVAGSRDWPQVVITPGAHPMCEAATALWAARPTTDNAPPPGNFGADDLDDLLWGLAQEASAPGRPVAKVVLVVDQFEELFILCDDGAERAEFISWLWRAASPGQPGGQLAVVACGLRADFYTQYTAHAELRRSLQAGQVMVGPMSEAELKTAITAPAKRAGLRIGPGLKELLLADLRATAGQPVVPDGDGGYGAGRLPLLAHALRTTWQQRHGAVLTVEGYRNTGRINGAIAATADHVYDGFDAGGQRAAKLMFLRLVKVGDTPASDGRRPVSRADLATSDTAAAVLAAYTGSRLLTGGSGDAVQITHEALLSAWPKLKDWLDEDRAGNLMRQGIEDSAAEWDRDGDDSGLYRGARLETAASWASTRLGELTQRARGFLEASQRAASRREHQRRQTIRRFQALTALLTAAVVALGITAYLALSENHEIHVQGIQAGSNEASSAALLLSGSDTGSNTPLAADLNIAAYHLNPAPSIAARLVSTENAPLPASVNAGSGAVYGLALSKNGRLMVTSGTNDPLRLWTVIATGHTYLESTINPPMTGTLDSVALTPDGRLLAVGSTAATSFALYDVADPAHPALIGKFPVKAAVGGLAVSPDGYLLAVGGFNGQVQLWNVANPAQPIQIGDPITASNIGGATTGPVRALAFSPDGKELASGGEDGIVRLWNLSNPAQAQPLGSVSAAGTHAGIAASETGTGATTVDSVAFSPSGQMLASTDVDDAMELWNVASPKRPQLLSQPTAPNTDEVFTSVFSPDSPVLATAGYDGAVRLWNIADPESPQPLGQPLAAGTGTVYSVAFSPDGTTLDSGGQDGTVQMWSLPRTLMVGPVGPVDSVAFSSDGQIMASCGAGGTVQLWDVADPANPRPLGKPLAPGGKASEVSSVAISPDGRTLAASDDAGILQLWDISHPESPRALGAGADLGDVLGGVLSRILGSRAGTSPLSDPMYSVAFSPKGQTMAVGDSFGLTVLINIADPARPDPISLGIPAGAGTESVQDMAFSPDGTHLAVSYSAGSVELWNVSGPVSAMLTGTPFTSGTLVPSSLAFSPDGQRLAIGNADGSVQLWNAVSPGQPRSLVSLTAGSGVSASPVDSVAISPDGRSLAVGRDDGTVSVWNLSAMPGSASAELEVLDTDTNRVNALAFSLNGTLATGSEDGTVQLWNLDVSAAITRVCSLAGSDLTRTQWNTYIPQLGYQSVCPA